VAIRRNELKRLKDSILERPNRFKKLKQEYRVFINWIANVALWSAPIALLPQLVSTPKPSLITWSWLACNSTIYTLYANLQKGNKQTLIRLAETLILWAIVTFIILRR